jgi:hypothetical protein
MEPVGAGTAAGGPVGSFISVSSMLSVTLRTYGDNLLFAMLA